MNQTTTVTITSLDGTQLYSQTVESLDLKAVIQAVNTPPPPAPAKKKPRSDKGKPRQRVFNSLPQLGPATE